MKTILAILAFLLVGLGIKASEVAITPIIFEIRHSDPTTLVCNGRKMTFQEATGWMQDTSSKFGRKDPVIIELEANEDIYFATELSRHALESYDKIYIKIRTGKPDKPFFFLPVSRDVEDWKFEYQVTSSFPLQRWHQFWEFSPMRAIDP